jgi:hypothetical protein
MSITLTQVNIYPIKSCAGISVRSARVEKRGLQFDRRWMIVDEANRFISQRSHPRLSLVKTALATDAIVLFIDGTEFDLPASLATGETLPVVIWDDTVSGIRFNGRINEAISEFLDDRVSLVYYPDSSSRQVNLSYGKQGDQASFADAYPFLLISEASLADLNARLAEPLPMNRFRPNFVVRGCEPYAEDDWKQFSIGLQSFRGAKPCGRCEVTTVDQQTGIAGKEPLTTLATYRKRGNSVYFGQNLIGESIGEVRVGDQIIVHD